MLRVASMLMIRVRSETPASASVHSILCWQSSRSVLHVPSGHSFSHTLSHETAGLAGGVAIIDTECFLVRVHKFGHHSSATAHFAADVGFDFC